MIFKLQRPLFTANANPKTVLIYNEDHSVMLNFPMDADAIATIFGNAFKVYVEGEVIHDEFLVNKVVQPQDW